MRLATISPVTTVGEMGVITGAAGDRRGHQTLENPLRQEGQTGCYPLRGHRDLKTRLYENVIAMLSDKLVRDNVRLRISWPPGRSSRMMSFTLR